MKRLTIVALTLSLGVPVFAQTRSYANTMNPVRPMPAPINSLPFGNVLFPGGVPSFGQRVSGSINGNIYPGYPGAGGYRGIRGGPGFPGGGYPGGGYRGRTMVVPYAVPVYAGPYMGYGDYPYDAQPNVTVVVPQQPTPSVIINQNYVPQEPGKPVLRDYSNVPLPETSVRVYDGSSSSSAATPPEPEATKPAPAAHASTPRDDRPTIYLIAMKDTTVRQAIGYWVDNNTLHYVTPKGSINHITMDIVDREMTVQLNAERKLEFDFNATARR